jgi:anoctamin-10
MRSWARPTSVRIDSSLPLLLSTMTNPDVDLVVVFRTTQTALSKQEAVDEATLAQREYQRLLDTLLNGGLMATGRVGLSQGQLIVLVYAPWSKVTQLVQTEQHSDFVLGLPCSSLPSHPRDFTKEPLLPAERLRLVHGYVTSLTSEGGLGVAPGAPEWPRLESVMALHDSSFNDRWLHAWTHRQFGFGVGYGQLCRIREQVDI